MKNCPYHALPESNWWKHSVADRPAAEILPYTADGLQLTPETRIGSAGSCFAQHISRVLQEHGYNYLSCENPPPGLPPETAAKYGYGAFSARYGNIYTPLQLLQLLDCAFHSFSPADRFWEDEAGRVYDLLRPRIVPRGFSSRRELESDLEQHLVKVRELFQKMDVFVFTLGLTEAWRSHEDGTVYPTCPGCGSPGVYDPKKYYFQNFKVNEVTEHLQAAIEKMLAVNPKLQIILTVSPVPLLATMEPRHVLQASTYSKSVLRVAAEEMRSRFDNVHYFASYELITATCQTNFFFEADRRTVTQSGIDYVMNLFFRQFTIGHKKLQPANPSPSPENAAAAGDRPICDEEDFFRAFSRQK